ncbi:kinase-like domain-containing protein [Peziza echinospora]|nr:kinase-like domain-containing protein [Peziza echinospora]
MEQVLDWVKHERQRQRDWISRREGKKASKASGGHGTAALASASASSASPASPAPPAPIATDGLVEGSKSGGVGGETPQPPSPVDRVGTPGSRSLKKNTSSRPSTSYGSDTDANAEGDVIVPECEVELKTPEAIGWDDFKREVLKLTHTLRCKGWRRIALDRFKEIEISRISGALTNAVFLVKPPAVGDFLPLTPGEKGNRKLLLRIYGEQVLHLIDRPSELSILRRLARKKIGPRLLGTFCNGRFEQYLESQTLTKGDIRDPSTSRMIAKRMKELHGGVEVLPEERLQGPTIWKNWEKWLPRVRGVMGVVDKTRKGSAEGLVCGVEWAVFEEAVKRYRQWLVSRYENGEATLREEMVFAHNDTQYGNILRMTPTTTDSPLLLPSNTHKQLVVIDFEYSSPNLPGFEFANHFCEWMADYHAKIPYKIHESRYPTPAEQRNFLLAYVQHQTRPIPTPQQSFNLDSPSATHLNSQENQEVERLVQETTAWRPASHTMWAAWGIVQAKGEEELQAERESGKEVEEGFDYLAYARERVMLFWGDMITLGVFTEEEVDGLLGGKGGWRQVGKDWK